MIIRGGLKRHSSQVLLSNMSNGITTQSSQAKVVYDMHHVQVNVKSRQVLGAMMDEDLFGTEDQEGHSLRLQYMRCIGMFQVPSTVYDMIKHIDNHKNEEDLLSRTLSINHLQSSKLVLYV
ncbi:hypothetical protein GOP47_0024356 [Adiantum capillus-veneris]|uniref:Uncharacterized protein n=1 Tax=Adiantum capillus-veneris TaxID=13818 RepID=A0A9D4Z4Y5_ADICA|nr:hypothetical protein GOP47_0024356 [Adiantum capillus-veneris]